MNTQTTGCAKLIVAGIPESEQSVESLTVRMPADLRPHSFQGMSADIVADDKGSELDQLHNRNQGRNTL